MTEGCYCYCLTVNFITACTLSYVIVRTVHGTCRSNVVFYNNLVHLMGELFNCNFYASHFFTAYSTVCYIVIRTVSFAGGFNNIIYLYFACNVTECRNHYCISMICIILTGIDYITIVFTCSINCCSFVIVTCCRNCLFNSVKLCITLCTVNNLII